MVMEAKSSDMKEVLITLHSKAEFEVAQAAEAGCAEVAF